MDDVPRLSDGSEIPICEHEWFPNENGTWQKCSKCGAETVCHEATKPLEKMKRDELVAELDHLELKLEDVPFGGKLPTNGDIKDYINSKR